MIPATPADFFARANTRNLAGLCLLRAILIVGLGVAALLAEQLQGIPLLHDGSIVGVLLLLTAVNLWTLWRLRQVGEAGEVGEALLFAQLLVDVLLMTLVFYRTGGSTNPFVSWYLVPLTIAAATLRLGFTAALAALTLSAYSLLMYRYIPFAPFGGMHAMPAVDLAATDPHMHDHMTLHQAQAESGGFNLHLFGMWLNFLLSAGLIAFFVSRMSRALREQDRQLAEQQQNLMQHEQVAALGALAAGAAHELGTPLATMTVIAADIDNDLPPESPLREDVTLLRRQLALCRDILGDLREQAVATRRLPLVRFLAAIVERMEVVYPARRFALAEAIPVGSLQPPPTLQQVLVNLLDNAAAAAREEIGICVRDEDGDCVIDITDDGPGIAPDIARRLGEAFVSGKQGGLGLGYFLSHASVNRMGGSIHLRARREGGTHTELRLPWSALQWQREDAA